jgi:protein gp37
MSDLFGIGIPEDWTRTILDAISHAKPHRFYLLTKQPQRLPEFSPFPENVYLGVTVTNQEMVDTAVYYLKMVQAKVKFLSCEPLLGRLSFDI